MLKEGRRKSAERPITIRRTDQRILGGEGGQRIDLRLGVEQLRPAHLGVDPVYGVAAFRPRLTDGLDDAAEQPHELSDLAAAGLIFPFGAAPALGEQRAHHLVEHVDGRIVQTTFQINELATTVARRRSTL